MQTISTAETVRFCGFSGRFYDYEVYPLRDMLWRRKPGNYMFAMCVESWFGTDWIPIYVGETRDLDDRIGNLLSHHKYLCSLIYRATHILAHLSDGRGIVRKWEERDLINQYQPICNGRPLPRYPKWTVNRDRLCNGWVIACS